MRVQSVSYFNRQSLCKLMLWNFSRKCVYKLMKSVPHAIDLLTVHCTGDSIECSSKTELRRFSCRRAVTYKYVCTCLFVIHCRTLFLQYPHSLMSGSESTSPTLYVILLVKRPSGRVGRGKQAPNPQKSQRSSATAIDISML